MKILVVSLSENDGKRLIGEIEKRLKIKSILLNNNDIKEINNIIIENKEWLIVINSSTIFDAIAKQADKIIYLNYNNSILDFNQITKYNRKIFILKNKNEEKFIIKSFDKGHEFYN